MRGKRIALVMLTAAIAASVAVADITLRTDRQLESWIQATYEPEGTRAVVDWTRLGFTVRRTIETVVPDEHELITRTPQADGCCEFVLAKYRSSDGFGELVHFMVSPSGEILQESRWRLPVAYLRAMAMESRAR